MSLFSGAALYPRFQFYAYVKCFLSAVLFFQSAFSSSGRLMAHVEKIYYLKGTMGKQEMGMRVYVYDEVKTRYATYFIAGQLKDHYLSGQLYEGSWEFGLSGQGEKEASQSKALLSIKEGTDGSWTGYYTAGNYDTLRIQLKEFKNEEVLSKFAHLDYVKELDPYENLRLSYVSFVKAEAEEKQKGLLAVWYKDEASGIRFLRLRDTKNKINTDSINTVLETMHLSLIKNASAFNPNRKAVTVSSEVSLLNNKLISLRILTRNQFYTLPPAAERELTALYIKSGKKVTLEDLLWFDKTAVPNNDLEKLYEYRKAKFGLPVYTIVKDLYPDKVKAEGCQLDSEEAWQFPMWSLTPKGLALGAAVVNECDALDWAIIPYARLKPYWNKKYRLK